MRLSPPEWTHHHTLRMFHLSNLIVWISVIFVLAYGMSIVWLQTRGETVAMSAVVPSITEGPISEGGGSGGGIFIDPLPRTPGQAPINVAPSLTISPDPAYSILKQVRVNGQLEWRYVFSSNPPVFYGQTSIPNALVVLEIDSGPAIRGTTQADGAGQWFWAPPYLVSQGPHTLHVKVTDPLDDRISISASLDFYIEANAVNRTDQLFTNPPPLQSGQKQLFNIFVEIPREYKIIAPGSQLLARIKLNESMQANRSVQANLFYSIENAFQGRVLGSSETVKLTREARLIKPFYTNPAVPEGLYRLVVTVPSENALNVASDTFQVKEGSGVPVGGSTGIKNNSLYSPLIFQGLLGMFFLFFLIAYFEYTKFSLISKTIKHIDETNLAALATKNA
jgi:hypothetical protein